MDYNIPPLDKEFIILLLLTFNNAPFFLQVFTSIITPLGITEKSGPDYMRHVRI